MPEFQPLWPRTSRSNGPGFAVLAPPAERGHYTSNGYTKVGGEQ